MKPRQPQPRPLPGAGTPWSALHPLVRAQLSTDAQGHVHSALLQHAQYPFVREIDRAQLDTDLFRVANEYLKLTQGLAGISTAVSQAVLNDDKADFGWLPISWGRPAGSGGMPDPRGSFMLTRQSHAQRRSSSVVLIAGYRDGAGRGTGGEVGLSLAVRLSDAPSAGKLSVYITGLITSNLPQGFNAVTGRPVLALDLPRLQQQLEDAAPNIVAVTIDGLAWVDPMQSSAWLVFATVCQAQREDPADNQRWRYEHWRVETLDDGAPPRIVSQTELVSHALPRVFACDPPAHAPAVPVERRRPGRRAKVLDPCRSITQRLPSTLQRGGNTLQVRQTRLGTAHGDPDKVQVIDSSKPLALRSDALAAAHAYLRGDELLRRIEAYGWLLGDYFMLTQLPLLLRHRASLKGARDGVTVNAQVRQIGNSVPIDQPYVAPDGTDLRPLAEVSFGWATLAQRRRLPSDAGQLRDQPLGLAADPRWAWHEFGHVLNLARIGALEFRFAHSAGDALAAIVADPGSALADHPWRRHLSFPWVATARRHDRDAITGWCWCGRRSWLRREQALPGAQPHAWLGYFEEQLLSTSLFRLYRCIGGDNLLPADRRSASDYVVYLVMCAIGLLGSTAAIPAKSVDGFVFALKTADIGADTWQVTTSWPEAEAPRTLLRIGGCVHKVIHWAFEQQGLPEDGGAAEAEGPAPPPRVDIYIEDRRVRADGGYHPVPLAATDLPTPQWHASLAGIRQDAGDVVVTVRNRGSVKATGVTVRCWVLPAATPARDDPSQWRELTASSTQPKDVSPTTPATFRFTAVDGMGAALVGDFAIKAAATCMQDPSNLEPSTGYPCATGSVPWVDLLANDNNLGFCVLRL